MKLKLFPWFNRNDDSQSSTLQQTEDKPKAEKKAALAVKFVPKPDPTDSWVELKEDKFTFVIGDEIYLQLMDYMVAGGQDEVQGAFNLDKERGELTSLTLHTVGGAGSVSLSADANANRVVQDTEKAGHHNGQWHSHGTMSAFWSRTDTDDQYDAVQAVKMIVSLTNQPANLYFMVVGFSGIDCKIRKVTVHPGGEVTYVDGYAERQNGTLLHIKRRTYTVSKTPVVVGKGGEDMTAAQLPLGYGYEGYEYGVFDYRTQKDFESRWGRDRETHVYFPQRSVRGELSIRDQATLINNSLTFVERKALADLFEKQIYEVADLIEEWLKSGEITDEEIYQFAATAVSDSFNQGE